MRRRKRRRTKGKKSRRHQSFKYGKAQSIKKYGVSRGGIRL